VRVDRHFQVERFGFIGDRFHFFQRELLGIDCGVWRQDAAGGAEFDDVGAVFLVFAHFLARGPGAVSGAAFDLVLKGQRGGIAAMTASDGNSLSGANNARADNFTLINRFAQIDIRISRGAKVADGCEAGFQRNLGIGDAANRGARGRNDQAT